MTTIAEWLAAQAHLARKRASKYTPDHANKRWYAAKAAAYEAAHAYAVARPDAPAGAASGGSGDLGALSAGAREAVLAVVRTAWALVDNTGHHDLLPLAINRDDWDELAARLTALKALLPAEELPADPPHAVAYFWPAEATPAISAPTPDLGAQGEPVAWAYEELRTRTFDEWEPALSYDRPGPASWFRNIEPLFKKAPAAPRPGSGVSVEEIARALYDADNRNLRNVWQWDQDGLDQEHPGTRERYLRQAGTVHALFAQAPRDGGETTRQDAPQADAVTDDDVDWLARKAIDTGDRTLARIAAALKVGRL